jgi:hypothetical protein
VAGPEIGRVKGGSATGLRSAGSAAIDPEMAVARATGPAPVPVPAIGQGQEAVPETDPAPVIDLVPVAVPEIGPGQAAVPEIGPATATGLLNPAPAAIARDGTAAIAREAASSGTDLRAARTGLMWGITSGSSTGPTSATT